MPKPLPLLWICCAKRFYLPCIHRKGRWKAFRGHERMLGQLSWEIQGGVLSFSFCISPVHNVGDTRDEGLTPGSGRSPGEGNGNPLQYSCLENPMDRGATVHRVTESDMTEWLNNRREIQDSHPWNWHFIPFQLTFQSQLFLGAFSKIMTEEANDFCM